MRFGLRQRFILLIFSLFLAIFTWVVALTVSRATVSERNAQNEQTKSFATLATKPISDAFVLYKDSGTVRIQQEIDKYWVLDPDVVGIGVVDTSGHYLFSRGNISPVSADQATAFSPTFVTSKGITKQVISPVVDTFGLHKYAVVYEISSKRLAETTQRTISLILTITVISFAVAIAVTYWLINKFFLSPVRNVSSKALSISNGHLEDQIELKRSDELGDLASAVNTMANSLKADIVKLQEADRLKTEFITISSHNMRTPLTVIQGNLEMMREMELQENVQSMVGDVASAASRLNNFVEDLLAISNMESGKLSVSSMQPSPIKVLVERAAEDYNHVAEVKKLEFKLDLNIGEEKVNMSQHLIRMALVNLLDNAFKFTKEGKVSLIVEKRDDQAVIKVTDTGIGITPQEIPKLFTKFHRGTDVMRYNYEGTGIGLYLTKLIIEEHHGKIEVDSQEGKGTSFTVTLPLVA